MKPNSESPLVSIIIPCWNAEAFVGDAIRSALNQTYPNVEVIVIDDGSTDDSLDVIKSYGKRIRWETGPNRGACAARNRGLELARGELIQFLDADDLLFPMKLFRMVPSALERGRNHLVICDWEREEKGSTGVIDHFFFRGESDFVICCTHSNLQTASPLHWKSNLDAIGGFDVTLPCAQERELHLRLACFGLKFVHIPEVFVRVRRQVGSVSSDSIRVIRQHLRIVRRANEILNELGRNNDSRASALAGLLARDARIFLRSGLNEEAGLYFVEAGKLHPIGGWDSAYLPLHRKVARILGAELFERLVSLKRKMAASHLNE